MVGKQGILYTTSGAGLKAVQIRFEWYFLGVGGRMFLEHSAEYDFEMVTTVTFNNKTCPIG